GFTLRGTLPRSRKLPGIRLRRVRVTQTDERGRAAPRDFFLRPSFVLPYCCGTVDGAANGVLLLSYGVPYHVVAVCCGRDAMYWYRLERALGRNSVAGTTGGGPPVLPPHPAAAGHHARLPRENT